MSLWQTQSWQEMLIASGQSDEYFIVEQDIKNIEDQIHKKVFVEKRKVSLGEYGLFVIGLEWNPDERLIDSLKNLCTEEKCLFFQIETINYYAEETKNKIQNKYYKKFIPPYTALINLTQSRDDILAAMKPKGRYNIKVARKKWVVVEQVEKHLGNIKVFHELMTETTTRDNFSGNTLEFYKVFLESLENSQLFFAYHEGEVIAAGIFTVSDNVMTYYYGASSSKKRNLMAPYLLQWNAIEHAKERWCSIYDFLWVAGDKELDSPLKWVTDFKMKLSPAKHYVSDSYLYVSKKVKYICIRFLKKVMKK